MLNAVAVPGVGALFWLDPVHTYEVHEESHRGRMRVTPRIGTASVNGVANRIESNRIGLIWAFGLWWEKNWDVGVLGNGNGGKALHRTLC